MSPPGDGLFDSPRPVHALADLLANVWQLGYVTTDLERGIEFMADRFGLTDCRHLPSDTATFLVGDTPAPWEVKVAMGARGGLIVELIEPVAGEIDFYTRVLPDPERFAVRLHHIATFTEPGEANWERIEALLAKSGLTVDYTVLIPGRVRAGYVDTTAELGHWPVDPSASPTAFERPLAALRFVLGSSCGRATRRILRPCPASTSGHSLCRTTYRRAHQSSASSRPRTSSSSARWSPAARDASRTLELATSRPGASSCLQARHRHTEET